MKNWRKKIQSIFSFKRNSRTSRDNDGVIMLGRQRDRITSQHRRLPPTPLSITPPSTIRQKTDDRMHLSQQSRATKCKEEEEKIHKSQEILHELGTKHVIKGGNGMNVKNRNNMKQTSVADFLTDSKKKKQTTVKDTLFVPEILVSKAENDEKCGLATTPKNVYVCGHLDNDMWHRLLVDLCREFSVRCISPSEYPECNKWLSKTDVFVFLIDDVSVVEPAYKDQLRLAIMLDLDLVYVRDLGFELKTKEKHDNILQSENEEENPTLEQTDPKLKDENLTKQQTRPRSASLQHRRRKSRSVEFKEENHLEPVGSNTKNLPEKLSERDDTLHLDMPENKHDSKSDALSSYAWRGAFSVEDNRELYSAGEIDIDKIIETEYGTSLVYHDLYHNKCLERIVSSIKSYEPSLNGGATSLSHSRHSLMSSAMSFGHSSRSVSFNELSLDRTRSYLHTPALSMYSSVSNDSALGDMFHRVTPEPNAKEADDHFSFERSLPSYDLSLPKGSLGQSETIYIVSPDNANEEFKVFHWPEDVEKESIANSPSIDSFGFQDIDLSKRVNEIDLFDGNLTD